MVIKKYYIVFKAILNEIKILIILLVTKLYLKYNTYNKILFL